MTRLIELTETEAAELIKAPTRDAPLSLVFGPRGASLPLDVTPKPLLQKLAELRGLA